MSIFTLELSLNSDFIKELKTHAKRFANKPTRVIPMGKAIWIFGTGHFGRDLCVALQRAGHTVAGFIETKPMVKQVMSLPLINWQQWSHKHSAAPLCIGIFNRGMPLDALEVLARQAGARDVFLPWDLYNSIKDDLGWRYWLGDPDQILSQTDAIAQALECLSDDTSKRCLIDITSFRLGLHTSYASFTHGENQYFNPLTLDAFHNKPISYVDGGAFTGDTYLELCKLAEVKSAYLFEPDSTNFAQLLINVPSTVHSAQCLPLGLSDSFRILSFNAGNGEGATITDNGTAQIAVMALDDLLSRHSIDFIKLDVEGAELEALKGAQRLIERCRPVLALSLYHRPQDLWELPLTLSRLCERYSFYIRQHFFNSFDSVLYAVPVQR